MNNPNSIVDIIPYINKDRIKIEEILINKGLQKGRAEYFAKSIEEDWTLSGDLSDEEKSKALQYGFFPSRIKLYGLNATNYQDYLSDIDYFRLHPINNHFAIWVNDKLTLKYIIPSIFHTIEGREISLMPEYYLYIENDGRYSYLMDSPNHIAHDSNYLINLLLEKKVLALKPSRGAGGRGFIKLKYEGGIIYANSQEINVADFETFKNSLNGYIVSEYITQHKALNAIWSESVCTLRIIAVRNYVNKFDGGKVDAIISYARFGTSLSNGASNLSSGGVGVPYNFNSGVFGDSFYQYLKFSHDGDFSLKEHPNSKVSLSGKVLPNWEIVRDVVYSICNYLSSLEYFGFDFIITDDGLKMCEINTHPSLDYEQAMCGPIWLNPEAKSFFERKIHEKR